MRRTVRGAIRLKHLNRSGTWPSGNPRLYYRPKGSKGIAMPDLPADHPDFLRAYVDATEGNAPAPQPRHHTGTIGAAVVAYLASDHYLSLAPSSRTLWRRWADAISQQYGAAPLRELQPKHIRADLSRLTANTSNHKRKVWRSMCRFWQDAGLIDADPSHQVRQRPAEYQGGHIAWTRADVDAYRAHWPHDTPQRVAFELLHRSCAAMVDACSLGAGHIRGGWLVYKRQKSGTQAVCPWAGGPAWFEPSDHLERCLEHAPRHVTFMVTGHGASRSPKAASSWFAASCRAAGVNKSAHGIRKHRAALFAENGATEAQRMAILGHETESEARDYSKSADLRRIISGTESSNSGNQLDIPAKNINENKD